MRLLADEWIATLRARAGDPRLGDARVALDAEVTAYLTALPSFPERQAGYYHEFFCPRHAVQLIFDRHSPHHHACPVDGQVFSGEPFDSAWRWSVNDALSDAALKLACHACLLGERPVGGDAATDQQRVVELLVGYADRYRTMPPAPRIHPNHPGVVTWSGLDESVWIIRLAWAYAFLSEMLPDDLDQQIRSNLLRPAAEHLRRVRWPEIHNVTNWNNAALATLAVVLHDDALLADALEPPLGLRAQLDRGVRGDGFWWEGSLSYHYYTLAAMIWTLRILRASGRTFDDDGIIRKMFHAPIELAFPDLSLPAIHDCWYSIALIGKVGHGIPDAAGFYEVAYGWYRDPAFAWVLQQNYARRQRSSFEALLDGALTVPNMSAPVFTSYHAVDSGLAVLRDYQPGGEQSYLMLKAGPAARDHGHPDQLSIQLFAHGVRMTADLGTPGYGIGLNDTWYRQTGSHSTVLLDNHSQPLAPGQIDHFRASGDFTMAAGSVSWNDGVYTGVRMHRTLLCRGDYFIDVFLVECPSQRQIDWLYHNSGVLIASLSGDVADGVLAGGCGYRHATDVRRIEPLDSACLRWHREDAQLELFLPGAEGEELFDGIAPANPASEDLSLIVRRRTTRRTAFLAVFAPSSQVSGSSVRSVEWLRTDEPPYECIVETLHGAEQWLIGPDPTVIRLTTLGD